VTVAGTARRGWVSATLGVAAVAVLLPLTTFLVSAWLLGLQLQNVQSGSMAPTYPVGSLLVVGQVDAAHVETGAAIVFEDPRTPGRLITHRVVRISPGDDLQFVTRGDANATVDPVPVPARLVRGHVLWQVTYLGSLLDWLQWPRSFVVLVLLPGLLLAWLEWHSRHRPATQRQERPPGREGRAALSP
jgi:signal peptidase